MWRRNKHIAIDGHCDGCVRSGTSGGSICREEAAAAAFGPECVCCGSNLLVNRQSCPSSLTVGFCACPFEHRLSLRTGICDHCLSQNRSRSEPSHSQRPILSIFLSVPSPSANCFGIHMCFPSSSSSGYSCS